LSGLQRRCEDTAQHTDVSIRFWLRSSDPTHPYKAPFELVGRQKTARSYWRLFLRFLCFSFRFWRLPEATRASLCRRSLTQAQRAALQAAWCALEGPEVTQQTKQARWSLANGAVTWTTAATMPPHSPGRLLHGTLGEALWSTT
jgi:hypothetical protein